MPVDMIKELKEMWAEKGIEAMADTLRELLGPNALTEREFISRMASNPMVGIRDCERLIPKVHRAICRAIAKREMERLKWAEDHIFILAALALQCVWDLRYFQATYKHEGFEARRRALVELFEANADPEQKTGLGLPEIDAVKKLHYLEVDRLGAEIVQHKEDEKLRFGPKRSHHRIKTSFD